MKKLRKISLENFDRLSSSEASRLVGGYTNPTIPPPKNTTPSSTTKPTVYGSVTPGGGYSGGYNGGNYDVHFTVKPGSVSGGVRVYF